MKTKLFLFSVWMIGAAALAVPFIIKTGSSPNMEDGDPPRTAWTMQNSNNAWLESHGGGGGGVPDPLSINTLNVTNANGSAAGFTNYFFQRLHFQVASNAFTNVIVGYLRFTNDDGRVFTIGVGTNMP